MHVFADEYRVQAGALCGPGWLLHGLACSWDWTQMHNSTNGGLCFEDSRRTEISLVLDRAGRIIDANDRALAAYGYSLQEFGQLSFHDLLGRSELAKCCQWYEAVANTGDVAFETCHRRKDGSPFAVNVRFHLHTSGEYTYIDTIVHDTSGQKCSEEALRRANRALRVLSAGNKAMTRPGDEIGLFQDICELITENGRYPLAWIGIKEDDPGRSVKIITSSGSGREYLTGIRVSWGDNARGRGPAGTCIRTSSITVINDAETDPTFLPWRRRAASYGYRSIISLPLRCEGQTIGALNIYATEPDAFGPEEKDLLEELATELSYGLEFRRARESQERMEAAAIQAATEFRTIFDSTNDAIFIADYDGRLLEVNREACRSLGYTRDELLQMTVQQIDSPESAALLPERLREIRERGTACFESVQMRRDGVPVEVELNARAVEYKRHQAVLAAARDIGERKRVEAALQARTAEMERSKKAADEANRAKSQFLANMSHEIRTPMNGIIGMMELALQTDLSDEQREYLSIAYDSADSMLSLLNDILDASKIEAGKLDFESIPFNLEHQVVETARPFALVAAQKGLELLCDIEAAMPVRLIGDPLRIRQIIGNLIGNAIKFTSQGEVTVRVESRGVREDTVTLHFAVSDTGAGIPAEKLNAIFEAFTQADGSITRRFGGTGLGLSIAYSLVRNMGGTMWLDSTLGQGSTFHFTLDMRIDHSGLADPAAAAQGLDGASVLILDGHASNRRIVTDIAANLGMRTTAIDECAVALSALRQALAEGAPFQLMIVDSGLAVADAVQWMHVARQEGLLRDTPILLAAAPGEFHISAASRDLGIVGSISKPVSRNEFLRSVRKALALPAPDSAPPGGRGGDTASHPARPLLVLLAEDNSVNRHLATRMLEKEGYRVVIANNGKEAVAHFEREPFDAVLMDVQMPEMDGYGATAAIRALERQQRRRHTPIIAVTAHAMKGDREECLRAGMDDHLSKPIKLKELKSVLDRQIQATPLLH